VGRTLLTKKSISFSKMTSSSKNPPFCIFEKKNLQKLDNKKTLQTQSRFLKSVKNWNFETKFTKIQVSDAILKDFQKRSSIKCNYYLALQNVKEIFEKFVF
jgi:hypothetical protein